MAGGGVGEAALLEAVIASEAAGVAAGGSLLGTALPAGGIAALSSGALGAGAGAAGAGLLGAEGAGLAAEMGGGIPSILQGTSALNPEIAAATQSALQPGAASAMGQPSMFPTESMLAQAETAQYGGQLSPFSPAGVGGEFNVVGPQGTAEIMQGVNPDFTRGFLPETITPSEPDPTKNPYPEFTPKTPRGASMDDIYGGPPAAPPAEPSIFQQAMKAYGDLNPIAKYGLGAMGASKALNYLDGNKYGTPEKEEYKGPLSKFKYDPSRYSPLVAQPRRMAGGGLSDLGGYADYAGGGRMLKGPGDGMSDSIPASIAGKQPARLANDEFVVPADVVSHLGNGSSDAGAKQLYRMMDKVRAARTGKKSQAKQINPAKYMPA
jgi:hypothetical protein